MSETEHIKEWVGKPVVAFESRSPFDMARAVPRLSLDWEAHVDGLGIGEILGELLRRPDVDRLEGLVFGTWDFLKAVDSSVIVETLVRSKDRLPRLRGLFLGDILDAEQELAWIAQSDLTSIFDSFPRLEELRVRGSSGLKLAGDGRLKHGALKSLIVESVGLPGDVVRTVLDAELPALEHLELWIGGTAQGASVTLDDFAPLFSGKLFPALTTLALKNAEDADGLARTIANAPILERLKKLDLSLGTLSDEGALALVESPLVKQLHDLDLRKSYLSPEMIKQLHALNPVIVDVRGSRFGKDAERRPSTVPPKRDVEIELPLARLRAKRA
jgi:hypothetical protein